MTNGRLQRRSGAALAGRWLALFGLLAGTSAQAASATDLSRAARRLGSAEFAARNQAGDVLLKAGASAIPYLREAAESEIPEIRFRATDLLHRIELQVLDSQKAEILSGSLAEGQLPAWDRYRQVVDDSESSRRLFVAMLDRSPQLMLSIGTPELADAFDRRINEWGPNQYVWGARRNNPEAAEEVAVILLAACQPECVPTTTQAQLLSRAAEFPTFQLQLSVPDRSAPLRSMLTAWIQQQGRNSAEHRLHLASHYALREGVAPAREIIAADAGGVEAQNAILYLARFGEDEDIPRLEKLLENDTELQSFQSRGRNEAMRTQVRDVALAALWKLQRQDPAKHGFKDYLETNGMPRPGAIGFQNDTDRQAAVQHWKTWRKEHVKANLPADGWAIEGFTS